MFEKEIDEIYELCKRVVNEVPAANITFDFSGYGLGVRGLKGKKMFSFSKTNLNGICTKTYLLTHFMRKKVVKVSE